MTEKQLVTITEPAQAYLRELLSNQDKEGVGIRIFVERPGTPYAECCMAYSMPGEEEEGDLRFEFEGFHAFIEGHSEKYLEDAVVDFKKDSMGGQLTFRAPKSKVPDLGPDSTVEERINHILYAEVNPQLASHGGNVQLVELTDDNYAILKFGGGCQGCSAVDMTLKDGVEKTLLEKVPELQGVRDQTDHTVKENAYY
ncbi:MAG: Fe-S biogenesis protein NfuA [Pseudomonadota bacterium]|nr:Fe-S biogenesis protein NfuA [Pseudomonadota bacterium]